jgi:uncharacterized membrane protein
MSTKETEKKQSSHTGFIVFLLIVILGVLLFILYMIYQYRQKTIMERLAQAFGVKKKKSKLGAVRERTIDKCMAGRQTSCQ